MSEAHLGNKIVITGTGRAGTTMLVQLLTELGLDTGIEGSRRQDFDEEAQAGFEHDIDQPGGPYIVKHPKLSNFLRSFLEKNRVTIDHAIIPIRELEAAARSRNRQSKGGMKPHVAGGLWGTEDPREQAAFLAKSFHGLMHTLAEFEVPFTFLEFPRFANDADYTFRQLKPIFPELEEKTFRVAFEAVSKPDKINTFTKADDRPAVAYRMTRFRMFLGGLKRRLGFGGE